MTTVATKIKITKITIDRAEGPIDWCIKTEHTTWADAEKRINDIRFTVDHDGYDKCDFKIEFEDGTVYDGRYDAEGMRKGGGGLAQHVRQHLEFISGEGRPYHMNDRDYKNCIARMKEREPTICENAKSFLANYSLED